MNNNIEMHLNYYASPRCCDISKTILHKPECKKQLIWLHDPISKLFRIVPVTCNQRRCPKCAKHRYIRAKIQLYKRGIKSRRLLHCAVGLPVNYSGSLADNKKLLEGIVSKFMRNLRSRLNIRALGAFDIAQRGSYLHIHLAFIPIGKQLDVRMCRRILRKVSADLIKGFRIFGYRSRDSIFDYFSKRQAGIYDHGKDSFFLDDIITYKEYREGFFRKRTLYVYSPRGVWLCSNISQIDIPEWIKKENTWIFITPPRDFKPVIPPPEKDMDAKEFNLYLSKCFGDSIVFDYATQLTSARDDEDY